MAKVTASEAAEAITESKGFITQAAKRLGISRQQLHNLINKHPTVKEALIDAREEMKDFTESKLYQAISDGNPTMIIFYAKTQMKDRGYVERQEKTGKDGGPIEIASVDLTALTDGQLKRLAAGEDIATILTNE
jgi:hypothetical protein